MKDRFPATYQKLSAEPFFIAFVLRKASTTPTAGRS
jgi:hypothetical protein